MREDDPELRLLEELTLTVTVTDSGTYYHDSDGYLHRKSGPAVIRGMYEMWFDHGRLHRRQRPAIVSPAYRAWYKAGRLHRKSGPAVIFSDGTREYWINGKQRYMLE